MSDENEYGGVYERAPAKPIVMCFQAPPDVMRAWFSGTDPEVGAGYVFRVEDVTTLADGSVSVSVNFVPTR